MADLHQLGVMHSLGTASRRRADFVARFSATSCVLCSIWSSFISTPFFCEPVDLLLFCQPDGDWLLRQ